jgi:X-Pro dipeptidyl-peptidase C-terminal non-catalytic domain
MTTRRFLCIAFVFLFSHVAIHAQDNGSYKTPPKDIADILLAKPTPNVSIDDKAEWMLFSETSLYPSVEELARPELITPNKVEEYTIDLHSLNHVFKKGDRIMVQVQSTWFPIIDRNPQKYVPNIFEATEKDFQMATQKIFHSLQWPSHIELSVME